MKVNKSIESDARGSFKQRRGPRGARRWQQDGHVHHDAGQDQVSLGAPGPDFQLDRVRRPSRAKTAPLRRVEGQKCHEADGLGGAEPPMTV